MTAAPDYDRLNRELDAQIDAIVADVSAGIGRLKDDNATMLAALKALCDADVSYHGNEIRITCGSHGDALGRMRKARAAVAQALFR